MPGIEDAIAELKKIRADVDAIPVQIDKLQTNFKLELMKQFQELAIQLDEIKGILTKHPELESTMKEILKEVGQ
jgi:hypothetical protein